MRHAVSAAPGQLHVEVGQARPPLEVQLRVRSIYWGIVVLAGATLASCLPPVGVKDGVVDGDTDALEPAPTSVTTPGGGNPGAGNPGAGDTAAGEVLPAEPVLPQQGGTSPAAPAGGSENQDGAVNLATLPLTVVGLEPSDASVDVPIESSSSITFSAPLDPTSVSISALQLTRSGAVPVAGSVTVEGSVVRFQPSEPLLLANAYSLHFEGTLRSVDGAQWTGSAEASFRTHEGAWSSPENVAISGDNPRIAFDPAGSALAIWNQLDTSQSGQAKLGMARFTPNARWQTLPAAPSGCGPECAPRLVAAGSDGSFQLVWAATGVINTQRFHPDEGFGVIGSTSARSGSFSAGVDAAVVDGQVWSVADLSQGIVISHMVDGLSWLPQAQPFLTDDRSPHAGPVLITSSAQPPRVFWADGPLILLTTFSAGAWSSPQPLSTRSDFVNVASFSGAGSALGHALLVWEEDLPDLDVPSIVTGQFDSILIDPDGTSKRTRPIPPASYVGNSVSPAASMNATGDAMLSWLQTAGNPDDADAPSRVWAAFRFAVSPAWSAVFPLSAADGTRARPPAVAVDPSGNGLAIWVEVDSAGSARLSSSRFLRESKLFGEAAPISGEAPVSPALTRSKRSGNDNCRLAVDAQGRALAIWSGSTGGIWASRFE
jgi:hypothetical protein